MSALLFTISWDWCVFFSPYFFFILFVLMRINRSTEHIMIYKLFNRWFGVYKGFYIFFLALEWVKLNLKISFSLSMSMMNSYILKLMVMAKVFWFTRTTKWATIIISLVFNSFVWIWCSWSTFIWMPMYHIILVICLIFQFQSMWMAVLGLWMKYLFI